MQPRRPILWAAGNGVVLFLLHHFWLNTESTLTGSLIFAAAVSLLSLGLLYGGEKLRRKWYGSNTN